MYIKPFFAASQSEYEDAKIVLLGMPLEKGVTFRGGCRFAPAAIRSASRSLEWYSHLHGTDLSDFAICDMGDLDVNLPISDLKMLVKGAIEDIQRDGKLPITIGGEHTITALTVPPTRADTAIIFDAHLDLKSAYGGDKYAHACVTRRIVEEIGCENVAVIGVRSGSKEEFEYAKDREILFYTSDEILSRGIDDVLNDVRSNLAGTKTYISIDMDVIDPSFAPAVSNPEPYGISPLIMRDFILELADTAVGFDIVEIAPPYDHGVTAVLGAKFITDFIHSYVSGVSE